MITLQCLLEFQNTQDKKAVLDLMRRFSSAMRYAYQRLLEGEKRKDLKKKLSKLFNINTRYSDDAIFLAQSMISLYKERQQNPKKVIFGSRKLFEQLSKNHLTGKRIRKLKEKWKESRQGNLYSRGDKSKQGNLNLRFERINNELYLRINTGDRQYIYAKVIRSVKREKDKWIEFMFMLENVYQIGEWFPYSVRLKTKNGKIYAFISIEEKLPPITIKKDNGIIGIDVNAYPYHLALAFASKDGNLEKYQSINLNELLEINSEKRQYLEWQIAHKIIEIAKEENKAIAIENLKKLPKGKRGDGFAKLRGKLQKWSYKRLLDKIEVLAKRNGIEIRKVNPAYTSIIGKLKYSPQYNIDKDIAGAYVIARRGLGYKERLPKNYKELLNDTDFLSYTIARIEDNIKKLKQKLKEEKNEYKRNRLKTKLSKLRKNLKILQKHVSLLTSHISRLENGKSKTATQHPVNQRKEQVRGLPAGRHKNWQVLSIALAFCCLEKSYRDFSSLKRVIISKDWTVVANRLAPACLAAGTMTLPKYRLLGSEVSEMAEYKYPNPNVQTDFYTFLQFYTVLYSLVDQALMYRTLLKSKVHRIKITGADLHYEGSLTLDEEIMEAANLVPFEKIEVYNVNNGQRFSTYVIPGVRYSGECILNGAAARLGHYGDIIIIASYAAVNEKDLESFKVNLVYIDENTNTIKEKKEVLALNSKVLAKTNE